MTATVTCRRHLGRGLQSRNTCRAREEGREACDTMPKWRDCCPWPGDPTTVAHAVMVQEGRQQLAQCPEPGRASRVPAELLRSDRCTQLAGRLWLAPSFCVWLHLQRCLVRARELLCPEMSARRSCRTGKHTFCFPSHCFIYDPCGCPPWGFPVPSMTPESS